MLDFGCGYHYPTIALLGGRVNTVAGLDIINVFYTDPLTKQLTDVGIPRGLFRYLSANVYDRYLDWFAYEEPTPEYRRPDTYDGKRFPYEADSFDTFYSNGAFHLIDNYEEIIEEISRVVAPVREHEFPERSVAARLQYPQLYPSSVQRQCAPAVGTSP